MAKKNLPKIVVISNISKLDTPDMISEASGIKLTGDPDATSPPVSDTDLHKDAADLQSIHDQRQIKPPTSTAEDEIVQRNKLARDFKKDALYVQGVANDIAVDAGDIAAGEAVVLRIGMKLKKPGKATSRYFEIFKSGSGWVHLRVKAADGDAAYIFEYGPTDAKGTPPPVFGKGVINLEANLMITNLRSGVIYGFRYAVVGRKHNPTHADGTEPYKFSDIIYFGIS